MAQNFVKFLKKSPKKYKIFFLDDDIMITEILRKTLTKMLQEQLKGYEFEYESFNDPNGSFIERVENGKPDFLLLDFHILLPGGKEVLGINVLKKMQKEYPDLTVIMLTSEDRLDTAVSLMREGAHDFVLKSPTAEVNLVKSISRKIAFLQLEFTNQRNRFFLKAGVLLWLITLAGLFLMWTFFSTSITKFK